MRGRACTQSQVFPTLASPRRPEPLRFSRLRARLSRTTDAVQAGRPRTLTRLVQTLPAQLLLFWGRWFRGEVSGPRDCEVGWRAEIMAGPCRQVYDTRGDI